MQISAFAQTIIISPATNQVLYIGETNTITWTPAVEGANLFISLHDGAQESTQDWIAFLAPNTGSYTWVVRKWNAGTRWVIKVGDARVNVSIVEKQTLTKPAPVPIVIKKVVSIEWNSNPEHIYRLETSTNLASWSIEYEGKSDTINAMALYYAESGNTFFRVTDLTP